MFDSLLKKHDPISVDSFGILKFFSEDLNEEELIELIKHLESYEAILLISELSGTSTSQKAKHVATNIIETSLENWIKNEVSFSNSIKGGDPRLINRKSQEFNNYINTLNNIGLSAKIKELLSFFILNTHIELLSKYLEKSFFSLFSNSSKTTIENFGFFLLSELKLKPNSNHLRRSYHHYINILAFSKYIFEIEQPLIEEIKLIKNIILKSLQNNKYDLKSLLLSEIIIHKELNLKFFEHDNLINNWLNTSLEENYKNLDLLKFLVRFKYDFKGYDFFSKLKEILKNLEFKEVAINGKKQFKINYQNSILNNSNLICDYIIFHIENLRKGELISGIIEVKNMFEAIKKEFSDLIGFGYLNNFQKISGEKHRLITDRFSSKKLTTGVSVKISQPSIVGKSLEFINDLKQDFPDCPLKKRQVDYGFLQIDNRKKSVVKSTANKVDLTAPRIEYYQIMSANYSPFNNGSVFRIRLYDDELHHFTHHLGIENLFGKFDLWILDQACKLCNIKLYDFGIPLKNIAYHFRYDYNQSLQHIQNYELFKKTCEKQFQKIHENIFLKSENDIKSFSKIRDLYTNEKHGNGRIINRVFGGYNVECEGITGFLPGSLLELSHFDFSHDSKNIIGSEISFKIISINNSHRTFILSHKAVVELEKEKEINEVFNILEKGLVLEGRVKDILDYGVFVDLNGADGLIHISDLSWGRINHPKEIVSISQKLNVVVLDFDKDNKKKIALGLKQLIQHPWDTVNTLKPGIIVKGKVVFIENTHALIEIVHGVEGLIHISEMFWGQNMRSAYEFLKIGDIVEAVILTINRDMQKITLSIKQLKQDPWGDIFLKFQIGSKYIGKVKKLTNFGIFLELETGVDGLIHKSEFTKNNIQPKDFCEIGDSINIIVDNIDPIKRHISLRIEQSLKGRDIVNDLIKLADFSFETGIGIQDLLKYLAEIGVNIEASPNALLSKDQIDIFMNNLPQIISKSNSTPIKNETLQKLKLKWPSKYNEN
jgi:ribosomal protein S1